MNSKKIFLPVLVATVISMTAQAQEKPVYKSLFWEISGNGLKKPSYLYGTMHVSDRVAFHLSDSFFIALKNVDMVALESNPETWMTEMYDVETAFDPGSMGMGMLTDMLGMYGFDASAFNLTEPTNDYFAAAMRYKPQPANHILYRGNTFNENFEEDTYLDMFIYQCGKKLKKDVVNLEDYEKTMELLFKASMPYDPEATDEEEKEDEEEDGFTPYYDYESGKSREDVIIEAYRKGDLDVLDSVQRKSAGRKHYYKYFIEERNEIMADNMDSIYKLGKTLFTGVGAAHLPADRGIINLLRKKGYTVRPVGFSARKDSKLKASIEKLKYPVEFARVMSKDSLFSVDIPGEMHEISSYQEGSREYFYPDVANGCYYSVKRFATYAPFFGKDLDVYTEKLDSLFFENIPGKTLKKTFAKTPEGYASWNITNRTRRGDLQMSRVIVTPLNIYFFRVSGTGDYVKGKEGERFLASIKINENNNGRSVHNANRNFHFFMPGNVIKEEENRFYSYDPGNGNSYNFRYFESADVSYIEEDTFELNILAENFMYSEDYRIRSRKLQSAKGVHSITSSHENKKGKKLYSHMMIAGKDYYHLSCDCKDEATAKNYFNSFRLEPYHYKNPFIEHHDTAMKFTVTIEKPDTSHNEKMKKITSKYYGSMDIFGYGGKKKKNKEDLSYLPQHKYTTFKSPSSGESVSIFYEKKHNYVMFDNAEKYWQKTFNESRSRGDDTYIYKNKKTYTKGNDHIIEFTLSDTGSTRGVLVKAILHGGVQYSMIAFYDTARGSGKFIQTIFDSFKPDDTLIGMSPLGDKTAMFMDNLLSSDTSKLKQALASYVHVWDELSDDQVKKIAVFMQSPEYGKLKDEWRLSLIEMSGYLEKDAMIEPLKKIFSAASDTMFLQVAVLEALMDIKSVNAIKAFAELLSNDPPLSEDEYELNFVQRLSDSIEIAKHAFPQLYSLLEYPEYRDNIYEIMAELAERGFLKPEDFKTQINRITRDASNELKRQLSDEEPDVDAYEASEEEYAYNYGYGNYDKSTGISKESRKDYLFSQNLPLTDKMFLMVPYYSSDAQVKSFFQKIMRSKDNTVRMQACLIMLKYDIPVDDTVWNYFMKGDKTRFETLRALNKLKKNVKYDVALADTAKLALSMATMGWNQTKTDSAKLFRTYDLTLKGLIKPRLYIFENERKETWSKTKKKELLYVLVDRGIKDPEDFEAELTQDISIPKTRTQDEVLEDLMREIRIFNHRRVRAGYYKKFKGYGSFGLGGFGEY